jgi:archaeal cell division control protein 6
MRGTLFSEGKGGFSERSIFRDEGVLYSDFLPDLLPHRDGQTQFLAECLKPLLSGRAPESVFIHGPAGVGKTSVARFVTRELKENTDIPVIYVNCWQNDTRHAVLTTVSYALGSFAPRRGTATDEIFERVVEGMKKRGGKGVVIVLDEIDRLLLNDGTQLLYDLTRGQTFSGKCGLVMISNDQYIMRKLDERTRSSLNYQDVEYPAYKFEELKDIFSERIKAAFADDGAKPGVNSAVAKFVTEQGGDVRLGLECLLRAGRLADELGKQLAPEHIGKVSGKIQNSKLKGIVAGLQPNYLELVRILADGKERTTGELRESFEKKAGEEVNERTFRNYLADLESKSIIESERSGKGQRGQTRIITLRNAEAIGRILKEMK